MGFRIGAAVAATLAVAIELTVAIYAPRCLPEPRPWPTAGGVIVIPGCRR